MAAERPAGRRRLAVISLHAHRPLAPRGERTRHLLDRLEGDWDVELIAPPPSLQTGGAAGSGRSNRARQLAARGVALALLDKWEPWSARRLARWRPEVDAALLIGHPYSPLVYGAKRLRAAGIPYVVDVGDPWVLTTSRHEMRPLALWRARRAERSLWEGCTGAVLTTEGQAEEVARLNPEMAILVRPNGFDAEPAPATRAIAAKPIGQPLRMAHFGMFNSQRLDPGPLLRGLVNSGLWSRLSFSQFGDDFVGFLERFPGDVEVQRYPAYPWSEILERAVSYDIAVVVGNVNSSQLPSKAVQYLTLPIPRLAICRPGDSLSSYVADMPGWLALDPAQPDAAALFSHLDREWSAEELAAPQAEGWPAVADTIAAFLERCLAAGQGTE